MPINPRVAKAFRAMKVLGIPEEKVKPILKNLLKLYDKSWELIEEENYRALADAIFDSEEAEAEQHKKKRDNSEREKKKLEDEAQDEEEPERPLKRLRLRHQEGQASASLCNSTPSLEGTALKKPKVEEDELPKSYPLRNKGKQSASPKSLTVQEGSDPSQIGDANGSKPAVMKRIVTPNSSPMLFRDREKERFLVESASIDKRRKMHNAQALIKPKEEPFTDEVPEFEVPLAVIHPDSLPEGGPFLENCTLEEQHGPEFPASQSVNGQGKAYDVPSSSNENKSKYELAKITEKSSIDLEIVSSPFGEVKISLSCNSDVERPDFHMPSLDEVLKVMEDKCTRSYKIIDPKFSLRELMKEMCVCAWELGNESKNESQETVIEATDDLRMNSAGTDILGVRGIPSDSVNGSVNDQCISNTDLPEIPRLPPTCNGVDDHTDSDGNRISNSGLTEKEQEQNGLEYTNSQSLVVFEHHQLTLDDTGALHDVNDITKGHEKLTISLANESSIGCPPSFHYISQNVVFENARMNFSLACIGDDKSCSTCGSDCLLSSTSCACAHKMGGDFVYTLEGLVKEQFLDEYISMKRDPQKHCIYYCKECMAERSKNEDILESCKGHLMRKFIKECWWKCGCSKQCGNRVVQRGINCSLQVFRTPEGKGWGLRTLNDLQKGTFVCEYVGEVLTNAELYDRISRSPDNEEQAYPVLLDAHWGLGGVVKDEDALCLDATYYGNVARFINHRCFDSNLIEIPVELETPDRHYYHTAFFTTRKVEALEELTWDYGMDFDDHDYLLKSFYCRCGSEFCRNIKRPRRSSCRR